MTGRESTVGSAALAFWRAFDELVHSSEIMVDRPKGEPHPRRPGLVYPLDYGYLEGTTAGDGDGIDVWLGTRAHARVTGIACTVDGHKRDAEVKLLLGCTDEEIAIVDRFLNFDVGLPCIVIRREMTIP
jgi:inorganic pyrophosphatase